ncbi:MAG TPA: bifunctional oligoribonuclease/PAP phosphatase NrnA [Aggregatilineaceae bacterium]|nr:bifunctional oligoribonuclease/PAP phosphatase NrnA [Aggregatilineaceae bacterium]
MRLDWDQARELVAGAQYITIVTHVNPDGDAIGSMLGLAHGLRHMGKAITAVVDGGVPVDLQFLPGAGDVLPLLDGVAADLTIAVDCGDESRMGQAGQAALQTGVPLINLDHHRTNTLFGQANLVDIQTVAASEGVLDWLDRMGVALEADSALCLLTGLVTDTLCFRTDNVTADTLGKAQRLMDAGGSLSEVVQRTVNRKSYTDLQLWTKVLPTVQLAEHVIWAVITQEMYRSVGMTEVDDGGLVSMLVQVEEAYIAAVFKEKPDGNIELGFRAVPGFDTANVAVVLGGGGHKLASGATVRGETMAILVPRVIEMLKAEVQRGMPEVER